MTTTVIHISKVPKGWDSTSDYIYIGRPRHELWLRGFDGFFGNPIIKGKKCPECGKVHIKPGDTLPCYKVYFTRRINSDNVFKERILALKDKVLVCYCKPNPCHGDIIAEYLNGI